MGWGDEILLSGEAKRLQESGVDNRPVLVVDIHGRARWSPLWVRNNRIIHLAETLWPREYQVLTNGPRCRPYIDYERMRRDFELVYPGRPFNPKKRDPRLPWRFTSHKCTVGELPFVKDLTPQRYVIIEPHTKVKASPNRIWGWEKWQAVVDAIPRLDWVQINPRGYRLLTGVRQIAADKFPNACRVMAGARAYVGPEGGLYHAAAAFGVPAVAVFGGFVSPANQGYDSDQYVNLYEPMGGESPCGQRVSCPHCKEAMERITVESVIGHVRQLLNC